MAIAATVAVALGASQLLVANTAGPLYHNSATGKAYPQEIPPVWSLATADGGVVTVANSPAPTDAGQVLMVTVPGRNAVAVFKGLPPASPVSTVAPTPIIPNTATSTGTNTYPSPALHSHRFGDNTACDGCVPVGRTSSSSGTQTTTNTGVSHIVWEKPAPAPTPAGLLLGEFTLTTTCTATSTSVVYTPVTGTKREEVEYLAAGGGAGHCPNPGGNYSQTGGGAAGENAFLHLNQSSQLDPWNYCAGAAGVGATSLVSATAGGDTLLYINSVLYTAKGGGASPNATSGADLMNGGAGAVHTGGGNPTWYFPGADGSYGIAPQANHMLAGAGASSRYGTGGKPTGGSGTNQYDDGHPATGWGAGGGGCYNNRNGSSFDNAGGNGSQGVIIVRDYTW